MDKSLPHFKYYGKICKLLADHPEAKRWNGKRDGRGEPISDDGGSEEQRKMYCDSPAADAVMAANHPAYEDGGPCSDCAFRKGTQANRTEHTVMLAALCVEGFREFHCHEHPHLCRGFVAALNLRGLPETEQEKQASETARIAADILAECIGLAKAVDERAG